MKVSERWLREWVNPEWTTEELSEALSLAGLEVDEVVAVAPEFSGVVVGHVVSVEKHPDADKLNVTQVDIGEDDCLQIVCGAPNVKAGMKACCACVGAVLPGDFKIKKAKLRGVPSAGMLCGASEIGLPDQGIDGLYVLPDSAPVGMDIREYLDLDDQVIDVDLTPNRADCLSIQGIARDVAAISGAPFHEPFAVKTVSKSAECAVSVQVVDAEACPKYLGCVVEGYDVAAETPDWIVSRLERSGLSSKSLAVDITNYVLLELGQPMHAFDADKIEGTLSVRFAQSNETLITLDDKTLTLHEDTLVVADEKGPVALAGIMGGLPTAVNEQTTRIFFECAHFAPLAITGRARKYGLHTDSSHRFERGVDPQLPEKALERALSLFTEIAGGQVSEVVRVLEESELPCPQSIHLRAKRIEKLLGVSLESDVVEGIFQRLGFTVNGMKDGWELTPPSYRFDMSIEADLIEEVGRVYGYNHLPETPLHAPMRLPHLPEAEQELHELKRALVHQGFQEVITYSFVDEKWRKAIQPSMAALQLKNPISDEMNAMRTSLLPGLLSVVSYNQKRQQSRMRLFESGLVFLNAEQGVSGLIQKPVLGGVITGSSEPQSWNQPSRTVDFYDLKGQVEHLLAMSHLADQARFEAKVFEFLHPGQSAAITVKGKEIGFLGQLHPALLKQGGLNGPVFVFEVNAEALSTLQLPKAQKISKFPEVQRDLAFVMPCQMPVQTVLDAINEVKTAHLRSVQVFDLYQGEGIAENQKSVALTLTLQDPERTLQDEEVDSLIDVIVESVSQKASAKLRE